MRRRVLGAVLTFVMYVPGLASAQTIADEPSRRQAIQLYRTGQEFMSGERYQQAADSFTAAVGKDPLLTVAHYQLGQAFMALKRPASALQAYRACVEAMLALRHLEESNKFEVDRQRQNAIREMRAELGGSQKIDDLKRTVIEQRIKEMEQERKLEPGGTFHTPAFVLLAMGSAHFRNGEREAAEAEWRAAIEESPKLGEAHNNLAVLYMTSGRKAAAKNSVKLAEQAGFRVHPQLKADIDQLPD